MAFGNDLKFGVGYNNTTNGGSNSIIDSNDILKNLSGLGDLFDNKSQVESGRSTMGGFGNIMGGSGLKLDYNTPSGSMNFLNNNQNNNGALSNSPLQDKLLGTNKRIGLLTGGASIVKDIGGLINTYQQLKLGKDQYRDNKKIYNGQQTSLQEERRRSTLGILDTSDFSKDYTEQQRQDYLNQNAYKPKFI